MLVWSLLGSQLTSSSPVPSVDPDNQIDLDPLTFAQQVAVETYKEANKQALAAASDATGAILTATFSTATAYGAVVAFVVPKDQPAPVFVVVPFALLAMAIVATMVGRTIGVSLGPTNTVETVRDHVARVVFLKRAFGIVAIVFVALGFVASGLVVSIAYRRSESNAPTRLQLTADGTKVVQALCSPAAPVTMIDGSLESGGAIPKDFVRFQLDAPVGTCVSRLVLPVNAVAALSGH